MKNVFLQDDLIYLSPITMEDISDQYVSWLNDPEVCNDNAHAVFPNNRIKTEEYVKSVSTSSTDLVFTIKMQEDDTHVGNVSLQGINWVNRSGEIAILIGDKNSWGNGIGSRCYKMLLKHAFLTLDLNRVQSGQTSRNVAMIGICKKSGMTHEGTLRQSLYKNGEYIDLEIFSILKEEYNG